MATLAATSTVTVNAAFFQEIKEASQELWQQIAAVRHCWLRPVSPSCRKLLDMLGDLRDQLAIYFSLEEFYGYFDDPAFVTPHLNQWAETLRNEHGDLYLELCQIIEHAEQLFYQGRQASLITQLAGRFEDFYQHLRKHETQEGELIVQMYAQEMGGGD